MYRNVIDFIDKQDDWKQKVREYTWNANGEPIELIEEVRPYLYFEHERGEAKSMFGTNITKIDFNNVIERRRWLNDNPTKRVFECNPPQRQYLMDKYQGQQLSPSFSEKTFKIHALDIEVEIGQEFPNPQDAKYPINVLTVYDTDLDEYHCFKVIKPGDEGQFTNEDKMYEGKVRRVIFHESSNEVMMLRDYLNWHCKNMPDVWTGWNLDGFDTPYIVNRMKRKLGGLVNKLSPTHKITPITKYMRNSHFSHETYIIEGITILDYLVLYRNKFEAKSKQSYKLEDIGALEVGFGKLSYEGHIRDFMRNEWKAFCWYNIYDVVVMVEVMKKTRLIELSRTICNMGLCEYESIFKSSPYIVGAMTIQGREGGRLMLSDDRSNKDDIEGGFIGAYVFKPRIGAFLWGLASIDLNSLYPNIMITNNISPETKVGKIIDEFDDGMNILFVGDKTHKFITRAQWKELRPKVIRAANDVLYCQPDINRGIFPNFLIKLYDKRVATKKLMKKNKNRINKLEEQYEDDVMPQEFIEDIVNMKDDNNRYDLTQWAYKIFLNSVYGQLGNKYFPLFDLDNASAVTVSGQHVIKESAKFLRNHYTKRFKNYNEDPIIAGDTDSVVGDTLIKTDNGEFRIEDLYNTYNKILPKSKQLTTNGHEMIKVDNLKCLTVKETDLTKPIMGKVKRLIRHKVSKKKYKVRVNGKEVIMTEDHGCVVVRNGKLVRVCPAEIKTNDKIITM